MSTYAPSVAASYDALAPHYESWTHDFEHSRWLQRLERLARRHGLRGRRVLDVACGTGRSLRPVLQLGYEGVGCDVSRRMLSVARAQVPGVPMVCADMRDLPDLGRFSWITCINDAINYLLEDADILRALSSMASALDIGGVLTFDVNTLPAHRSLFDSTFALNAGGSLLCWHGKGRAATRGEIGTTDISIFAGDGERWTRTVSRHQQRWWSDDDIAGAAEATGWRVVGRYGQRHGGIVEEHVDERRHSKIVYFLRRRRRD